MRAMILAAGRGERLRPFTDTIPKPLLVVKGQPLIIYHLQKLAIAGFQEVVINLSHLGEQIREMLGNGNRWDLNIHYSQEPKNALDTGGGIQQALTLLGDAPFAVINGDIYCDYPLTRLRAIKCDHVHLVLVPNPEHNPEGDFSLRGGYVGLTGQPLHTFSGISVYHPRFFDSAPGGCFSVKPMLRTAAKLQQVTGEIYGGEWHDVGTPERLQILQNC